MINKRISNLKHICKDYTKIENYEEAINDKTQVWHCHHRNERFYTEQELIDLGLYYDCPPCELIFLKPKDHYAEYHKGRIIGANKMRETKKGRKPHNKNKVKISTYWDFYISVYMQLFKKPYVCSDETKKKISKSKKDKKGHNQTEHTKELISNANSKKILCIELNKEFKNSKQAADYLGAKSPCKIRECARGIRASAYSYHWKFIEKENK